MNFKHAVGFLFLGTVFGLLPRMAPGLCNVVDGEAMSTRELWLQSMSFVQIGLAGAYLFRRACSYIALVMAYTVVKSGVLEPSVEAIGELAVESDDLEIVTVRRPALAARLHPRAAVASVDSFDAGLLEPRRAA